MADAVISTVVHKFRSYLLQEASLLYGVLDEVEWLERELQGMECFLEDADSKQKQNDERVKKWVRDIIDVTYDAEDVIETFMLRADSLTPRGSFQLMLTGCTPTAPLENFMLTIGRCFPMLTSLVSHCRAGREKIEDLSTRITEISKRRKRLGIVGSGETRGERSNSVYGTLQESRPLPQHADSCIVGFVEDKRKIIEHVLNNEEKLCVISIIGKPGQGKTTLAEYIHSSEEITDEFTNNFYISVSKDSKAPEILRTIIDEVRGREKVGKLDQGIQKKLHEMLLSRGKYLIILDGVYKMELWDEIQPAFADSSSGSRVIFTTDCIDVAGSSDSSIILHELSLNTADSMELFLNKVYTNQTVEALSEELNVVAEKLLEKCQGLPLAIIVLCGFLSTEEKDHHRWSRVLNSLNWESSEEDTCFCVLYFCYKAMPFYLKACFLYIGSFPRNSEIPARRLIRLWISEGLIPPKSGETSTETAEAILEELVRRSMVQVAERRWDDSIKMIRVHDLIHDLCQMEAREYGFLHSGSSHVAANQPTSPTIKRARRLVLHLFKSESYMHRSTKKWKAPNLRTLVIGSNVSELSLKGLKLLRVLDVEVADSSVQLPKEINNLVHLKYLRWRAFVNYQHIKNLHNLQTLQVIFGIEKADASIGEFKDLQFLSSIKAGEWVENGLIKLTSLQKLRIKDIKNHNWQALIKSLGKLHSLVSLSLTTFEKTIPTEAISILSGHQSLRRLSLFGGLSRKTQLPESSAFPPNLTKLVLLFCKLKKDPMPILKELPHLRCLRLKEDAYEGKRMHCQAGGFTQLQYLEIHCLYEFKDWEVDDGAMPSVTHLFISCCRNLSMLPEGLQYMSTVQELRLRQMSYEFNKRILDGEDLYKVAHIPNLIL